MQPTAREHWVSFSWRHATIDYAKCVCLMIACKGKEYNAKHAHTHYHRLRFPIPSYTTSGPGSGRVQYVNQEVGMVNGFAVESSSHSQQGQHVMGLLFYECYSVLKLIVMPHRSDSRQQSLVGVLLLLHITL